MHGLCEAISVVEPLKVKNLCLKSSLCTVDREGLACLFTNPFLHILCKGTYITYFVLPPVRSKGTMELMDVSFPRQHDGTMYAEKVRNPLHVYLADVEYPKSGSS